jgi:hypothetical protein
VDEVRERLLAVDLDDRQELPVARLELGVAGDVHLVEVELDVLPDRVERRSRPLAEAALRRGVENDLCSRCYGYRPRVVVASETLCTASPYAAMRMLVPRF